MRRSLEISRTIKTGVKSGQPTLVVFVSDAARITPSHRQVAQGSRGGSEIAEATKVGFVVSKAVGNAVTRNRIKRQLRHLIRPLIAEVDLPLMVVVRALPTAATAAASLDDELRAAWQSALRKYLRRRNHHRHDPPHDEYPGTARPESVPVSSYPEK